MAGQAVSYRHRGCLSKTQCQLFGATHHSDMKLCCTTGKKRPQLSTRIWGPVCQQEHTLARWGCILLHVQSEPNSLMVQFKRNTLKTLCSALRNKAKQSLRWDWETTLARLRPRVSAGVEVTLVALPELCLLVRIRPEECKDNHIVNELLTKAAAVSNTLYTQLPGVQKKFMGRGNTFY